MNSTQKCNVDIKNDISSTKSLKLLPIAMLVSAAMGAQTAMAVNECGADTPGQNTVSCAAGAFPAGITYTNSDGITVELNDASINVSDPGVDVISAAASAGDITINALQVGNIATSSTTAHGIRAENSGTGNATVVLSAGSITTTGATSNGVISVNTNANSTADVTAIMNGGEITTSGDTSSGVVARGEGMSGNVLAQVNNNSIINASGDRGHGVAAAVVNTASTANAEAELTNGNITIAGDSAFGIFTTNDGLGNALATMSGGNINTTGQSADGIFVQQANQTQPSTGVASIDITGGTIQTSGNDSIGAQAINFSFGDAVVTASDTSITTQDDFAEGVRARVGTAASSANAEATVNNSTINTSGEDAYGIRARNQGLGNADAEMNEGSIDTNTGEEGHGIFSSVDNANSTARARASASNGTINTGGLQAFGVYSRNIGSGDSLAEIESSEVTTLGDSGHGALAQIANTTSTGTATALSNDGTIETSGVAARGIFAATNGLGSSLAQMDGGSILVTGVNSDGVFSQNTNAAAPATATATAIVNNGVIVTEGLSGDGVYANNFGLGAATATANDADITTTGDGAQGLRAQVINATSTATAEATMNGGEINTAGEDSHGIRAQSNGLGESLAVINDGGSVTTNGEAAAGILSVILNSASNATGTALLNDGSVLTTGDNASGILSAVFSAPGTGSSFAQATINSGSVITSGDNSAGISAVNEGLGNVAVDFNDGTVQSIGLNSDGISARAVNGTFDVNVNAGEITSGNGMSAGIRTAAAAGGTVNIASGAVIDGSASGIAIRDGDSDFDGIDEIGGDIVVTTAGEITGDVILGLGNDTFNLTGGSITGDIFGDDTAASASDGDDTFNWTGGSLNGDFFGQNGSDTAVIGAGANYNGSQVLDGGDDVSTADGYIDRLTIQGHDITTASTQIINWETVTIDGGSIQFTDNQFTVGSDPGTGLFLANGALLEGRDEFALTGNLDVSSGSRFEATGGGSGIYSVSGSLNNNGLVTLQDGSAGDVLTVAGDYAGQGRLEVDVDFANDISDRLVIEGALAEDTATVVSVNDITTGDATGNLVPVVDVASGQPGNFVLENGPIASGAFFYDFNLNERGFALAAEQAPTPTPTPGTNPGTNGGTPRTVQNTPFQASFLPQIATFELLPQLLLTMNGLDGLERRTDLYELRNNALANDEEARQDSLLRARIKGKRSTVDTDRSATNADFSLNTFELQIGGDVTIFEDEDDRVDVGAYFKASNGSGTVASAFGGGEIDDLDSQGVGITATWYSEESLYVDLQGAYNDYDIDLKPDVILQNDASTNFKSVFVRNSGQFDIQNHDGEGYVASIEVGKKYTDGLWNYVPQAQLQYSEVDFNDFVGPNGERVSLGDGSKTTGRLGISVTKRGDEEASWNTYGLANLIYDFDNDTQVNIGGFGLDTELDQLSGEIGLGGRYLINNNLSLKGEVSYKTSLENFSDSEEYGGFINAEYRF